MTTATIPGLTFDPEPHVYRFNGDVIPSVTQILEPLIDYGSVPGAILDHAAQRGTAVHLATEFYDDDDLDEATIDPEILPYVEAWRTFREESGFAVLQSEVRVYSARHRYAGTVDTIGLLDGRLAMVEKKTTAILHPATAVQVTAYGRAYNEIVGPGERVRSIHSVHLRRDGTYRFDEYDSGTHWGMFLALRYPDHPQSAATRAAWEAYYLR